MRGTFCINVFYFLCISIIHNLLYKDCCIASRLKDLFLYCCLKKKNPVHLHDDFLLFHEIEDWFGLGGLLGLQENDVEPCALGRFNSTNNRNGKSYRILKLRKSFLCFGCDICVI